MDFGTVLLIVIGLGELLLALVAFFNKKAVHELHLAVNSRLDELLKKTAEASHARGKLEGAAGERTLEGGEVENARLAARSLIEDAEARALLLIDEARRTAGQMSGGTPGLREDAIAAADENLLGAQRAKDALTGNSPEGAAEDARRAVRKQADDDSNYPRDG